MLSIKKTIKLFIFTLMMICYAAWASSTGMITISNFVISPDGSELYTINLFEDDTIYAVDTTTGKTIKKIPIGNRAHNLVMSKDGKALFVAANEAIVRIDTLNKAVSAKIELPKDSIVNATDITQDNSIIISSDMTRVSGNNDLKAYIHIIDAKTNRLINNIPKKELPDFRAYGFNSVLIDHQGKKAYLADDENPSIAIFDMQTQSLQLNAIPTDFHISAGRMGINSSDTLLYVPIFDEAKLAIIDLRTKKVVAEVADVKDTIDVALTLDNKKIYAVSRNEHSIIVVDAKNYTRIKKIRVDYVPLYFQLSQDGKRLFVAVFPGIIYIIDTDKDEVIKTFDINAEK